MSDSARFVWPVRIYYEDTDSGGVVYYANYLRFMERARTERLRQLGFNQEQLKNEAGLLFAVHKLSITYQRPACLDDLLLVTAHIERVRKTSLEFKQTISNAATEQCLCEGQVSIACLDADSFRPKAVPDYLLRELADVI
ncbi:MAG: tol-pal system-associated acyl-CoA thioesterase [Gammaproteobacteria bacterium]